MVKTGIKKLLKLYHWLKRKLLYSPSLYKKDISCFNKFYQGESLFCPNNTKKRRIYNLSHTYFWLVHYTWSFPVCSLHGGRIVQPLFVRSQDLHMIWTWNFTWCVPWFFSYFVTWQTQNQFLMTSAKQREPPASFVWGLVNLSLSP